MSPQHPNRGTDLPGRKPGLRRFAPAITAVAVGVLSFGVGLQLLSVAKMVAPASGNAAAAQNPADDTEAVAQNFVEPLEEPRKTDLKPDPQPKPEPLPPESFAFAGKKPGDEWSANGLGMRFCWCPEGTFTMGSPKNEKEREPQYYQFSEDQVVVKLTKGFWLGKFEVTQALWEKVMGTNLRAQIKKTDDQTYQDYINSPKGVPRSAWAQLAGEGSNYPMYFVNHVEATAFCQKLTEQEQKTGRLPRGWEYRLPTDAQWEYACRAGTKTATAFGDRLSSYQANFKGGYPYNGAANGPTLGLMRPVGSYRPNAWGLCDMHGNAAEWCRDCYLANLPGGTDPEVMSNPGRSSGEADRVLRGGSWQSYGSDCRSARRYGYAPASRDYRWGFRVAVVMPNPKPNLVPSPDPKPLPAGTVVNSIGIKLAPIPAGKFLMGSPPDEPGRPQTGFGLVDYETQHEVTIREPFYLGIYLVTQDQYRYVMGDSPNYFPSNFSHEGLGKENVKEFKDTKWFPQECVSWDNAQEFCRRLSALPAEKAHKRVYRLPTQAEWEYACRAGTATRYYFGNDINKSQANFNGDLGRTTPVGHYANPNKFGLYDMHGNLWEWCEDAYAPYQQDPKNPKPPGGRVLRGGAFINYGYDCRSASRNAASDHVGHVTYGFRVALSAGARTR
ncbi:MAG: formylglycine-generating enzyme family protein [Gemmataceae bacterium]